MQPVGSTRLPERPFCLIAPDVKLGVNVRIYSFTNLYGCEIGDDTKIGTFVEIQKGVRIGRRCKISSHTFICEGVIIEDEVFVGHNVTFINDLYPRATNADGALQTEADWECIPTRIKRGASIGSGATLLAGITVGEHALVGAGSVVTRDVPPWTVVAGNPARILRRLESLETCPSNIIP
jgi:UDP-2-acetamido-3-amino-2,3-dideoxy-glucuronate N-acetyltransferase